jgi:pimeloyl-ACP methyl ester carboxylesterase
VRAGDGRLVTIDGAGHFPYAERPEAWVAAVRAFVNRR